MIPQDAPFKVIHAGIDHTYTTRNIDTDHDLVYADLRTELYPAELPYPKPQPEPAYKSLTNIPVVLPSDNSEDPDTQA